MIPGHLLLSHTLFICEDFNYNLLNQFTSKFKKIGFKHIFTTDVICQMSFVRCHLSDVICQMSFDK